jgi:hypothetical protein
MIARITREQRPPRVILSIRPSGFESMAALKPFDGRYQCAFIDAGRRNVGVRGEIPDSTEQVITRFQGLVGLG